ncbi:hypothetical protein AMJ49_00460 [Parcubacteria bacterium DG_74_2]|nr:MAG: hypothetical protein AMJ49_00460 [Parcubacteria bacterium DG_74_2]
MKDYNLPTTSSHSLSEWAPKIKKIVPSQLLSFYHFILAFLGALIYRFPSKKIKVIGVTGTNGKTTVVEMVTRILEEAGYKVASLSSIKFKIGGKELINVLRMTMPGRFFIQRFLRQAVDSNCQYAVLEVTSEGIKQYRQKFIDFNTTIFTNLSPEHIEAHGNFENYKITKGKLFKENKNIHIINLDDNNTSYFLEFPAKKKYGYTINNQKKETNNKKLFIIHCVLLAADQNRLSFEIQKTKFNLKLFGKFNVYNALAAISFALSQEISLEICQNALEKITGIPGRMEKVISTPFKIFVDYAFTPNALEKIYCVLKENFKPKRIICVLGSCGGGRDKWKRPVLGSLAKKHCDEIIITNEDPYDEDPMEIIKQIAVGAGDKAKKILERRKAIKQALKLAKENDLIIITGKGCEPSICLAYGKKIPWDDRKVIKEEFQKIYGEI